MNRATKNDSWAQNPDGSLGYTCNLVTGCLNHDSGLCKGGNFPCYAYRLANGRLRERYKANINVAPVELSTHPSAWAAAINSKLCLQTLDPFYPRFWMDRVEKLDRFLKQSREPVGVFLDIMGDWMGDWVPESWIDWHFELMRRYPQHRFYTLTKQPQNLPRFSPFPDNCWVGVTATNEGYYVEALFWLAQIKAKVKYVSLEPLLGRIPLKGFATESVLDWLVIGACTGTRDEIKQLIYRYPGLTPMPVDMNMRRWTAQPQIKWVKEIVEAADKAHIPVFLKDNLSPLIKAEKGEHFYLRQEVPV